jgi:hypothetical protein
MKTTVKILFIVSMLSGAVFSQTKYWEDLGSRKKEKFLNDTNTNKLAIDFYYGKFKTSDDSLTIELLDKIIEKKDFNPFYFFLFNKILYSADGAIAELIGEYCYKIISDNNIIVLKYFVRQRKSDTDNTLCIKYGNFLGWKFAADIKSNVKDKSEYEKFRNILMTSLQDSSDEDKEISYLLIKQMDSAFENTQ